MTADRSQNYLLDPAQRPAPVKWWTPNVPAEELAKLRAPIDGPALRNFALWLALLGATGAAAWASYGTWWMIPAFLAYGTLYSSSDARSHELNHGTVFKSKRLNTFWFHVTSFMTLREGYLWRYSHTRHHTHTIVVGADPEIQVSRPADLLVILADFFYLYSGPHEMKRIARNALFGLDPETRAFVPQRAWARLVRSSRIHLALWVVVLGLSVITLSFLPVLLVLGPRFYAGWHHQLMGLTQHAGLAEDTSDHRENTRTVLTNPVFAFLYMNMNYHLEHHVSPTLPYHALPRFHELIKAECPPPYPSVLSAYREMIPTLWRQAFGDPDAHITRPIPT